MKTRFVQDADMLADSAMGQAMQAKKLCDEARTSQNEVAMHYQLLGAREASIASFALSVAALTTLAVGVAKRAEELENQ